MKKLFIVLMLLFIPSFLYAEPSFYGPTGLVEMPTAKAIEYKKVGVALDYRFNKGNRSNGQTYYKLNMGTYENLELGIVGGAVPTEGVFVNIKYFMLSDSEVYPTSLAIGIQNLGSKTDSNLYLVASKLFEGGLEGHFGFRMTFDKEVDAAAMLGVEYFMDDRLSFLADYTGKSRRYTLNLGARYYIKEHISARFSVLDLNKTREEAETIMVTGISFSKFM